MSFYGRISTYQGTRYSITSPPVSCSYRHGTVRFKACALRLARQKVLSHVSQSLKSWARSRDLGATPQIKSHAHIEMSMQQPRKYQRPFPSPATAPHALTPHDLTIITPSESPPPFLTADFSLTTPLHPTGQLNQRSHLRMGLGHAMISSR